MKFLRANTAVRIAVGPFLDATDGVTPELSLTVTNDHITMTVDDDDGTAVNLVIDTDATVSGGDNDMVHIPNDNAGMYDLELTQAQTNYAGHRGMLAITDAANHCPVFHELFFLPAPVYDSLFGGVATAHGVVLGSAAYELVVDSTGKVADTPGISTLLTRVPQIISMAQIGGTGVYYVEVLTSNGDIVANVGAKMDLLDTIMEDA